MTALKPIENRRVRAVASERYPLNEICAHPDCSEPTADPHHIFPRSLIAGDSWFVEIELDPAEGFAVDDLLVVIPHVAGLCREHHEQLERHDAWVKLEDGVFVWYDRVRPAEGRGVRPGDSTFEEVEWAQVGALDPQPGGREKSRKRRRKLQGEARRKRKTISLRVPDDTEDGGAIWDETLEETKAKLVQLGLYDEGDAIPNYEAVIAGLRDWLNG